VPPGEPVYGHVAAASNVHALRPAGRTRPSQG
jgi:hypothetical protein